MTSKIVALITGANGGIGYETALVFAKASEEYHVLVGSRSLEKGEKAVEEIKKQKIKGDVSLIQLDVTDDTSITKAVAKVEAEFGKLDVLVNNAGIFPKVETTPREYFQKTFETNTIGPAVVTDAFLPLMTKAESARLVYVSSGLGSIALKEKSPAGTPRDLYLAYCMSKAALNMLMVADSVDLTERGMKVFAVCPGYVVSNLTGEKGRQDRIAKGAGSPVVSAETILSCVEGRRDADAGKFVYKDGVYAW
ncbi:short-chain dehydrogenase [Phlyctema vagabunda]|uniref:Short-chain dehydrogenase n=1 Tax=Phlyctema vagabunda TaxID=108571 RepID=A0ABR4PCD6_9HELO